MKNNLQSYEHNGFIQFDDFLDDSDREILVEASIELSNASTEIRRNSFKANPKIKTPFTNIINKLNASFPSLSITPYCFYLEKTHDKNWPLAFHQDINLPEFLNLDETEKNRWISNGIWIRVCIDPSNQDSGALKVIAGSHKGGVIKSYQEHSKRLYTYLDTAENDVILFSPLILHGSDKLKVPSKRRVFQCYCLLEKIGTSAIKKIV